MHGHAHIGGRDYACTVEGSVVTNKLNDTYTCTQGMLTGTMEADGTQWTVTGLLREFNTTSRIMLSLEFLPAEYDPDATPAWLRHRAGRHDRRAPRGL